MEELTKTPTYGIIGETAVVDEFGSTITTAVTFRKGKPVELVRRTYVTNRRVTKQQEELEEYLKFSDKLAHNRNILNPTARIIHSINGDKKGYYTIVFSYELLEQQ